MIVIRKLYNQKREGEIVSYTQSCMDAVVGKNYDSIRSFITALTDKCLAFSVALKQAEDGGKSFITTKKESLVALKKSWQTYTLQLEALANAQNNPALVTDAKLEIVPQRGGRKFEPYDPCTKVLIEQTKFPNEFLITFDNNGAKGVTTHMIEWCLVVDGEPEVWHQGNFTKKQRMVIRGVAKGSVKARVKIIGTNNRESPWAESNVLSVP